MDLNSWGRSPGSPGPGRPADSALATVITDHHSTYVIGEYIAPDPDPVYPPIWDDDDDYVPILPPSVTVNTDGEDMTVAVHDRGRRGMRGGRGAGGADAHARLDDQEEMSQTLRVRAPPDSGNPYRPVVGRMRLYPRGGGSEDT